MAGDNAAAERIATTMMPPGLAQGLQPFFDRLPSLGPIDRAFAVHFGELRPTPERVADSRMIPALAPLPPDVFESSGSGCRGAKCEADPAGRSPQPQIETRSPTGPGGERSAARAAAAAAGSMSPKRRAALYAARPRARGGATAHDAQSGSKPLEVHADADLGHFRAGHFRAGHDHQTAHERSRSLA